MALLWMCIIAFFGYFGWWLLVPIVVAGLLWDGHKLFAKFHPPGGPREIALKEAAQGAAVIVLAALAFLYLGSVLPAWSPGAELATMIWGGLRFNNGKKFSVGWRDPKLIANALVMAGCGAAIHGLVAMPGAWVPVGVRTAIALALYETAPYGEWAVTAVTVWLLVGGVTKLFLVLRGFPMPPFPPPGMPHGGASWG